jgi:hypothetical protein
MNTNLGNKQLVMMLNFKIVRTALNLDNLIFEISF